METNKTPTTYQEFLKLHATFSQPPIVAQQLDEAAGGEEIVETKKIRVEEIPQQQQQENSEESISVLTDLCRVCGNKGIISLYVEPPVNLLCFKPSRESMENKTTIGQMISELSGEIIEKNDLLPQYICGHCTQYLQHAYNIRCQIRQTSNNLRLVKQIHSEEGTLLRQSPPSSTIPTISENQAVIPPAVFLNENQKEIIEEKEQIEGEKYWNEVITKKYAKITIAVPSVKKNERLTEHKCNSCGKRVYSIKSLNQHTDICIIAQLTTFFSQLQLLYQAFLVNKISSFNYQMQALSLIYNTNKILKKIAKKAKFELGALSPEVSTAEINRTMSFEQTTRRQNNSTRFYSPDNGYNSGNT